MGAAGASVAGPEVPSRLPSSMPPATDVVPTTSPTPDPPRSQAPAPICLVHGPFGSGKSTLLVTLLRFLLRARTVAGSPLEGARILVSSGTNVAVDRVLMGEPGGW